MRKSRDRVPDRWQHLTLKPPLSLATQAVGPEPPAAAAAPPSAPIALLVCHGMGQQLPYETLQAAADAIATAPTGGRITATSCRLVRLGDAVFPRVELTVEHEKRKQEVHVYEIYWAPLTEAVIRLREVINFLLGAAWNGIRFAAPGSFRRWAFGGYREFRMARGKTAASLAAAILLIAALLWINTVLTLYIIRALVSALDGAAVVSPRVMDLTRDAATGLWLSLILGAMAIGLARLGSWSRRPGAGWQLLAQFLLGGAQAASITVIAAVCAASFAMLADLLPAAPVFSSAAEALAGFLEGWKALSLLPARLEPLPGALVIGGIWLLILLLSNGVRLWLHQYVGDVAIYVSGYRVNRFWDVRDRVRKAAQDVAQGVYGALAMPEGERLYGRVLVVGHSLGSVVLYDTLNALIRQDLIARAAGESAADLRSDERTSHLITFGCPLDKTAYLFRIQSARQAVVRESLAGLRQPLIDEYKYRPQRWVNIWSRLDWISGPLDFYDDPDGHSGDGKRIVNREDPQAWLPVACHGSYWGNRMVGEELWEAIFPGKE